MTGYLPRLTVVDPIPASIHDWCGQLDDPARGWPCPCRAWKESAPRPEPRKLPTLAERTRDRVSLETVAAAVLAARGVA